MIAANYPQNTEGTRAWLAKHILEAPDRLLFWVKSVDGTPLGTIGLAHLQCEQEQVEMEHLFRGAPGVLPGVMYAAVQTLVGWAFQSLPVQRITLETFADNVRAIRLCERCGFGGATRKPSEIKQPLSASSSAEKGDKGWKISMTLTRNEWMAGHRMARVA
jgi:RimJ/RimL family protein N-acetyltransferase